MCLSIPSRVKKIDKAENLATVETMGVERVASLALVEEGSVEVDDFVLIHIGFVMNKIDKTEALQTLDTYKEILEIMDQEELERVIKEDDNCLKRD